MKMNLWKILLLVLVIYLAFDYYYFSIDQSKIPTHFIGHQQWMTENLCVSNFRNGDPIKEAKTQEEWTRACENKEPVWCYYDNDSRNSRYGKLYNGYAINDSRGLAPIGFHIPSQKEWQVLTAYLFGGIEGIRLKSETGWKSNGSEDGNGTNNTGFTGLPGGFRSGLSLDFVDLGFSGNWWSSTAADILGEDVAWVRSLSNKNSKLEQFRASFCSGFSVRCIKDE